MYIEIVPNQTFLTELQGSKVDGGALSAPPPCKVGLMEEAAIKYCSAP